MIQKLGTFKQWLTQNGAEILRNTNPYELLRFRANDMTSIIYTSDSGRHTFTGDADRAYNCFRASKPWSGHNKNKGSVGVDTQTLLERDGDACFYCLKAMEPGERTREHLLAIVHGGSHHISNQVLSHRTCNQNAGHLSVIQKIKIREQALIGEAYARIEKLQKEIVKL